MFPATVFYYIYQSIIFLPQTVAVVIGLGGCWRCRRRNRHEMALIATGLIVLLADIYFGSMFDVAFIMNWASLQNRLNGGLRSPDWRDPILDAIKEIPQVMWHWPASLLRAIGILLILRAVFLLARSQTANSELH